MSVERECRECRDRKTTAEDVKRVLSDYLRDNHPDGGWASAMFDTGEDGHPETLVAVTPSCPLSSSESAPQSPD